MDLRLWIRVKSEGVIVGNCERMVMYVHEEYVSSLMMSWL